MKMYSKSTTRFLLLGACALLPTNESIRAENTCARGDYFVASENMCVPDIGPLPVMVPMPPSNLNYSAGTISEPGYFRGRILEKKDENDRTWFTVEDVYLKKLKFYSDATTGGAKDRAPNERVLIQLDVQKPDHVKSFEDWYGTKEELGRMLFCDTRLSKQGPYGCANCHIPGNGFAHPNPSALGVGPSIGTRNVPTLINVALGATYSWDGRAGSLEEQATEPLHHKREMGMTVQELIDKLKAAEDAVTDPYPYRGKFNDVFGGRITFQAVVEAIAAFERTIISSDSPFDRYSLDLETAEFGDSQKRGLALFKGRARCIVCHNGPNFTDNQFHNVGYPKIGDPKHTDDDGRFTITRRPSDKGAFKTPTLRGLKYTGPYMHDGLLGSPGTDPNDEEKITANLLTVLEHFAKGGEENPNRDPLLKPITPELSDDEKRDLIAFLKALTGPRIEITTNAIKRCPIGDNP